MNQNDDSRGQITQLLRAWSAGDGAAASRVLEMVYDRIRHLASRRLSSDDQRRPLDPTELANELVVNLLDSQVNWNDRAHFYRTVAVAMRNILHDLARRQGSAKRGGGQVRVSLRAAEEISGPNGDDSEALYQALTQLRASDPRKADVIELSYLVGLELDEVARVLDVSLPTVNRDLRFARTWLKLRLQS